MSEPGSAAAVVSGVAAFALLTSIGLAGGLGALALLRTPADAVRRLLLAPFAITLVWALTGNLLVRSGFTMAQASLPIAILSLGFAAVGVASVVRRRLEPRVMALVIGLGLVTGLVAWPYFARGLTAHLGSPNFDTVNYTSVAASFWRYGLDPTSASLPYFRNYAPVAQALGRARNHTFVLLGLLSPLVEPGEPIFVRNLLVCWSLLVLASSLAFYRAAWDGTHEGRETQTGAILFYALLTLGLGWAVVPTLVGNWDNGLFVAMGPVLAGLVAELPGTGPRAAILLGVTAAYAGYTYPELAPLLALFLAPLYLPALASPATRRPTLRAYILAGALAGMLLVPGINALWVYFERQLAGARRPGPRPGGAFAGGLASAPFDPSGWWALGAEHTGRSDWWQWSCGLLLTGLALAGLLRLARRRRWPEVAALGLVAASLAYYVLVDRYGYAAYKILSVAWWLVGRGLVEGCAALVALAGAAEDAAPAGCRRRGLAAAALAALLLTSLSVAERERARVFFDETLFRREPTLAALSRLRAAAASQPPMDALVVGPSLDELTVPWIFYALKDSSLRLYARGSRARLALGGSDLPPDGPLPANALLVAADVPGGSTRFRTPEFALVDFETLMSVPVVEDVDSPNSLETWGTWLGTRPIIIMLLSRSGLASTLSFEAAPGPSLPGTPRRTILLRSGSREIGRVEIDGRADVVFPFTTAGGRQILTLSTPDVPTVARMPNGDARPLVVSVRNLRVGLATNEPTPRSRQAPASSGRAKSATR